MELSKTDILAVEREVLRIYLKISTGVDSGHIGFI
jgi:hypothetical protein